MDAEMPKKQLIQTQAATRRQHRASAPTSRPSTQRRCSGAMTGRVERRQARSANQVGRSYVAFHSTQCENVARGSVQRKKDNAKTVRPEVGAWQKSMRLNAKRCVIEKVTNEADFFRVTTIIHRSVLREDSEPEMTPILSKTAQVGYRRMGSTEATARGRIERSGLACAFRLNGDLGSVPIAVSPRVVYGRCLLAPG
jgi:hypothetical protein